ncbi:MAG: hypothetical protein PVH77_00995 [Phycisphaerales bacterium]|jgi:hypothetical protein
MLDESQILAALQDYELSHKCFHNYLKWLFSNCSDSLEKNDLIRTITTDSGRLERLEKLLNSSKSILGLNTMDFCNVFGFKRELLTGDHEKVHDILAEPLLAVTLNNLGFSDIEKLPKFIKSNNNRLPIADFLACFQSKFYAIELKTIRMEDESKTHQEGPLPPALIPSWWRTMLISNIFTKIKNKDHKLIKQLQNTCQHYGCDTTMLAIYTMRSGPSALSGVDEYEEDLKYIAGQCTNIDSFLIKDHSDQIAIYPPI